MRGGCLCGSFRYRLKGEPKSSVNCHCGMCRRHSGASFLTYVAVAQTSFHVETGTLVPYRSSEHAVRTHCGTCGSPMTFVFDTDPETIWVTAGSLDHPNLCPPSENWFIHDKLAWTMLDDHIKAWEGAPPEG